MLPRSNSAPAAPALLRLAACALAVVIYTCLVTVKSTLYFPFCRTLVVCSANRSRAGGGAVGPSASPAATLDENKRFEGSERERVSDERGGARTRATRREGATGRSDVSWHNHEPREGYHADVQI